MRSNLNILRDAYDGRRVLVTGHTGFKGTWLCLMLEHLGADVIGLSLDDDADRTFFETVAPGTTLDHRLGDLRRPDVVSALIEEVRPSIILHLGAQALVLDSYDDPVGTFETNVMGTLHVLDTVRRTGDVDGVVVVTSDKVYRNDDTGRPFVEDDALGGHDPYSASKAATEMAAHSFQHSFLRDTSTGLATARAGNVIGGGDWAANRIVPDAIRAWSAGEDLLVRNPTATRPWQYVLDPLLGYLLLGARLVEPDGDVDGESFNFGPSAASHRPVGDLVDALTAHWPEARWSTPPAGGRPPFESRLLDLDCSKAATILGWHPVTDLQAAVDLTMGWYRCWNEGGDTAALAREQVAGILTAAD